MSRIEWIALNSVKGLGPVRIKHLVDRYGSAEEVFKRPRSELRESGLVPDSCIGGLFSNSLFSEAEAQAALADQKGVSVLTLASAEYPPYLKEIFAPPPVLFVRGDFSIFSLHAVAVVGTRSPSTYGKTVTRTITRELVSQGLAIVSGLARGIDTIAHQTCLEEKGRTIAVLGCGIDCIYPAENEPLAAAIAQNGAVVSEFPPGTEPEPFNFPRRNRIISGLAAGVLVVEGGEKSGGLITASYALQQGRDVFAVPGPITSPLSRATFNLLKEGAIPARSGHEIANALSLIANPHLKSAGASGTISGAPLSLLSDAERAVYELITDTPRRIDELTEAAGRPMMQLFDLLLMLELKGFIRQLSGQQYVRA